MHRLHGSEIVREGGKGVLCRCRQLTAGAWGGSALGQMWRNRELKEEGHLSKFVGVHGGALVKSPILNVAHFI